MTFPLDLQEIKPPQQGRSRRTLERIVRATEELIQERSFNEVTILDITRRAGVATGSFYNRFSAKDGVLNALYADFLEDTEATITAAVDPGRQGSASLADRVRRVVAALIGLYRRRGAVARSVSMHHRLHSGSASDELRTRIDAIHRQVAECLLAAREEIRHPEPERAAAFSVTLLELSCREKLLFADYPVPDATRTSDQRLERGLTRTLVGYLTLEAL